MRTLVVAPHPDDETLGVGGTIARKSKEGNDLVWLIMTSISEKDGWDRDKVSERQVEIQRVSEILGIQQVVQLSYPTTKLDLVPLPELISSISNVLSSCVPDEIFIPHPSDIHSDHKRTYESVVSSAKWFRSSSIKKIYAYETLSETGMDSINPAQFNPNFFVNIESELKTKIKSMKVYESEIRDFPFPRSEEAILALSRIRGAQAGFKAAEAFQLLKEVY